MNLILPPQLSGGSRSAESEDSPSASSLSESGTSAAADFSALMRATLAQNGATSERPAHPGSATPRPDGLAAAAGASQAGRVETTPVAEPQGEPDARQSGLANGTTPPVAAEAIEDSNTDEETEATTSPVGDETSPTFGATMVGWVPPLDLPPAAPLPPGSFGGTAVGDSGRASASVRIEEERPAAALVEADGTWGTGRGLGAETNTPRPDGAAAGTWGEAAPTSLRSDRSNAPLASAPPSPLPAAARALNGPVVETHLPSPPSEGVEVAREDGEIAQREATPSAGIEPEMEAAPSPSTLRPGSAVMPARATGGISTAEHGARMRSELLPPRGVENKESGTREGAGRDDLLMLSPAWAEGVEPAEAGVRFSSPDSSLDEMEAAARRVSAMDWPMGRPAEIELSRPSPVEVPGTLDRVAEIERLSDLMIRESGSLRQTGEGSLAVVLRPDEQTQLFVEMAQREGYIEAQVRCERGDARHLGALWGQLQEALGQQNIRLAPLQDASGGGQAGSHGSPPLGTGDSADANADRHSPRQPVAEQHPWEERSGRRPAEGSRPLFRNPDPARSVAATVPGWETWA